MMLRWSTFSESVNVVIVQDLRVLFTNTSSSNESCILFVVFFFIYLYLVSCWRNVPLARLLILVNCFDNNECETVEDP